MTSKHVISMAAALIMVVWSSGVFFDAMEGEVLWKQIASAIGALLFWVLFAATCISLIRTTRAANEQIRQSHTEA